MSEEKKVTPPSSGGGAGPAAGCVSGCASASPPSPPPEPWLRDALAVMCPKDKAFLDDLRARGVTITAFDRIYYEDPFFDGTKWTTRHFEGGGSTSGTDMNIVLKSIDDKGVAHDRTPAKVAETIYHEGIHTGQPESMPWSEKEYEAYIKGEQWAIDHGLPGRPGFRMKDAKGNPIPDTKAIRKFVDEKYPIALDKPKAPGGPVYKVVGKTPTGDTIIRNVRDPKDIKTRKPRKGDTFDGPQIEEPPGGRPVHPDQLKCP